MRRSFVERFVPERPPDWQRGALRRAAKETPAGVHTRTSAALRRDVELWHLPGASDFGCDPALSNTVLLLRELRAIGVAEDLIGRCASARSRSRGRGGRPRDRGSFELLYLACADLGFGAHQRFHSKLTSEILTVCGFDRLPSPSLLYQRFAELESVWREFQATKNTLVRVCVAAEPRLADAISVDATLQRSPYRLESMGAAGYRREMERRAAVLTSSAADATQRAHLAEVDDPKWGDDDAPPQTRSRLPEQLLVGAPGRHATLYSLFRVDGVLRRSLDPDAGLRAYGNTRTVVFGYYALAGSSMFVGEPVDVVIFPADVNEYDGLPELDRGLVDALGRRWPVVSSDRGFFLRTCHEFWTRRGTAIVTPMKSKIGTGTIESFRNDLFDEHGVPRCRACRGPGNQSYPGLGLTFKRTRPVIRYRCLAQLTPQCRHTHSIPCDLEPLLLTGLSRLREPFHSLRERHSNHERSFRHNRQRFRVGGRELADSLPRRGVAAHQLRIEAGLLLLWARLALRNGWIAPVLIDVDFNPHTAVLLSGRQNRRSLEIIEAGIGTPRLRALLRRRALKGLDLPYSYAFNPTVDPGDGR